jgi:hypothetical protein
MDGITATELELLGCFAAEPQILDPGVPWYFCRGRFVNCR